MSNITPAERRAIATALGLHEQSLYQCLPRRRATPAEHCPDIERTRGGKLPCEQLRPDVRWHRVADAAWPWHPAGRPLIDVARQPASAQQETRDAA